MRRTGCKLPIEVWFPDKELPSCEKKKELTKLGVTVRAFGDLEENIKQKSFIPYKSKRAFQKYSFMYKMFAMVFSSFEEVLSLDSDIVSVRNPDFLFESKLYKKHGSVFWMDFWNSSSAPDCQRILGQQTLLQHSHESGQRRRERRAAFRRPPASAIFARSKGNSAASAAPDATDARAARSPNGAAAPPGRT